MIDDAYPSAYIARRPRRSRVRVDLLAMTAAGAIIVGSLPRFSTRPELPTAPPVQATALVEPEMARGTTPASNENAWLFDPEPVLGSRVQGMRRVAALTTALEPVARLAPVRPTASKPVAVVSEFPAVRVSGSPVKQAANQPPSQISASSQIQRTALVAPAPAPALQTVPLPLRRPSDLMLVPAPSVARLAERSRNATRQQNQEAERSFFDTVFGAKPSGGDQQALAYAGVDTEGLGVSARRSSPVPQPGTGTAIYDISAARVTLPSGEVLEAHSGLGSSFDNPHDVHRRMRGSTPPGTYDLTEREALFHGVRALRLHPVGGAGAIHNRNGLLAHTYMLGAAGASNGCISFRNYKRFLQAYLSGEVRRVVVVAGYKGDRGSSFASRLFGRSASAE